MSPVQRTTPSISDSPERSGILGPIDYLAVEWPGRHVTGEGFRLLMDLVDRDRPQQRAARRAGRIVADDLIAALDAPERA